MNAVQFSRDNLLQLYKNRTTPCKIVIASTPCSKYKNYQKELTYLHLNNDMGGGEADGQQNKVLLE